MVWVRAVPVDGQTKVNCDDNNFQVYHPHYLHFHSSAPQVRGQITPILQPSRQKRIALIEEGHCALGLKPGVGASDARCYTRTKFQFQMHGPGVFAHLAGQLPVTELSKHTTAPAATQRVALPTGVVLS